MAGAPLASLRALNVSERHLDIRARRGKATAGPDRCVDGVFESQKADESGELLPQLLDAITERLLGDDDQVTEDLVHRRFEHVGELLPVPLVGEVLTALPLGDVGIADGSVVARAQAIAEPLLRQAATFAQLADPLADFFAHGPSYRGIGAGAHEATLPPVRVRTATVRKFRRKSDYGLCIILAARNYHLEESMDTITQEQVRSFARVGGAADLAGDAVNSLRSLAAVTLADEDFAEPLQEELRAIRDRLGQIEYDLDILARGVDNDTLRHRLGHRGAEPAGDADREQLAAIEGAKAA